MSNKRALYILGTRGVPASHGGFETFAERFALHMVTQDWHVTCYCQVDALPSQTEPVTDMWRGIHRVTFSADKSPLGTIKFDLACIRHAFKQDGVMLVLGYNTAIFSAVLRLTKNPLLMNMDGIEWQRAKWPWHGKLWFWLNEGIGALTSHKLIADHPEIAMHLSRWRPPNDIIMIPYGGDVVVSAPTAAVEELGLIPGRYVISICRIEKENNILPMIEAYAERPRDFGFVCLGNLDPAGNRYHAAVLAASKDRVKFAGAIYEKTRIQSLRYHALAYCHGHSVGGTNPSLVEALGAGNIILAHDNPYNRWVAGDGQLFFTDKGEFSQRCDELDELDDERQAALRTSARKRFDEAFHWLPVLEEYRMLCERSLSTMVPGQPGKKEYDKILKF